MVRRGRYPALYAVAKLWTTSINAAALLIESTAPALYKEAVIPQNNYLIHNRTSDDAKCLVHVLGRKAYLVIQI